MKISYTRFNKQDKVSFSKVGHLTKKNTAEQILTKTIMEAYNKMLNDPNTTAVSITLRKEVK
jgi:hypothetical protein